MFNHNQFRDPALATTLIEGIKQRAAEVGALKVAAGKANSIRIMEVCGTHTMAIAKNGLRDIMPENVILSSGPGCPVCVTANKDIDMAIELAKQQDTIVTTFGDMLKVPGSYSSLNAEKAKGADVRVVYSPLDALLIAEQNPDKQVVFISVGFETTTPIIAASLKRAKEMDLKNFSIFAANKTVPGALRAIANDPDIDVDGLLLPGHVSTIIGEHPYAFLATEFHIASAIAGFEPVDVLQGIFMLLDELARMYMAGEGATTTVLNAYPRGVMREGNPVALKTLEDVFEAGDTEWRGLGLIEGTGLFIRDEFNDFDALKRFDLSPPAPKEIKGCQCGDILRGVLMPSDCRLFARACTPEHPIGPCMVSSEGSCAAYYRFTDLGR